MVWEHSPEEGRRGLHELRQLTHGALAEMRTLLFELRPAALLEKKLGDLVTQVAAALDSRTRASIDVMAHDEGSLPPDVHVALFRIVQEALCCVCLTMDRASIPPRCQWVNWALAVCVNGPGTSAHD